MPHLEAVADRCGIFLAGAWSATLAGGGPLASALLPADGTGARKVRARAPSRPPAAADLANLPVVQTTLKGSHAALPVPALLTRRTTAPSTCLAAKGEMVRVALK